MLPRKMRATLPVCFAALTALSLPARAAEETKVVKPDGQEFTVRSDEAGTTVSKDGKAQAPPASRRSKRNIRNACRTC